MTTLSPLLCFLPYALISLLHIFCCAAGKQTLRRATKVLLMPLLMLAYALVSAKAEACVFLALLFGWIGDLLLIRPDVKPRQVGGIAAFLIGHCFYLFLLWQRIGDCGGLRLVWLPPLVFLILAAADGLFQLPVVPKDMRLPGTVYFLFLAALGAFSGIALLGGAVRGWAFLCGAALFLCSDSILCRQFFTVGNPAPKHDFAVMLTYILAQFFLVFGFCA